MNGTTDTIKNRQYAGTDVYFFGWSSSGPVGSNKLCQEMDAEKVSGSYRRQRKAYSPPELAIPGN